MVARLVGGCLALAALTLLAPSSPSFDPFAWIVWGRELMPGVAAEPFTLAGGPSWKPLPVLFTAPFALAGSAAPALWLLVARAGLLLALAGAYALGARLAGRWAGLLAAVFVLLLDDVISLAWRGASEPLLLAAILWAIERHLAGRRAVAFALGVAAALIRPEALPFLALYAAWLWRGWGRRERALLAAGLALVPLLWIGVPGLAGDPLAASTTAQNPSTRTGAASALRGDLALVPAVVWALALAGLVVRRSERAVRGLALAAVSWLSLLAAMAAAGYASPSRYGLPAAACAVLLAGIGAADLVARRRHPAAVVALLVCAGLAAQRATTLDDQLRAGTQVARAHEELRAAVATAGGAAALRACALHGGWIATNHTTGSALAWELRLPLDRVARTMRRPGLLVRAARGAATGAPPQVALRRPISIDARAHAGRWDVLAVRSAGTSLPPACAGRKASGAPRRIPNI